MTVLVATILITSLFGLAFGSFLNAAIYRLAIKESLLGRSHCIKCSYILQWYDLIPLGSFLILRGECRSCKQKISKQYFLVELVTAILFGLAAYFWIQAGGEFIISSVALLIRDLFIILVLIFLFVYDAKYYLLPDIITLPAILILTIWQLLLGESWQLLLLASLIGGGFFFIQYAVSKGKWIGGGDIRLGVLMGIILGWPLIVVGLFLSYIIGATVSVPLLLSKTKKLNSQIPFGMFLTLGTIITMWWGIGMLDWYLGFL